MKVMSTLQGTTSSILMNVPAEPAQCFDERASPEEGIPMDKHDERSSAPEMFVHECSDPDPRPSSESNGL
jgi:hypothetical protein